MVGWIEFGMDSTRAISMELQISFTFLWLGSLSFDCPHSDGFVIKWTPQPPSIGREWRCVIFFSRCNARAFLLVIGNKDSKHVCMLQRKNTNSHTFLALSMAKDLTLMPLI